MEIPTTMKQKFVLSLLVINLIISAVESAWDPYQVLGLKRSASSQDIRKAYKQYAKEWHPDKNKEENAEAKFVEINKAYEILSDPVRRKLYDQRGIVDDSPNHRSTQPPDHFSDIPPFFSHSESFKFKFKMPEMSFYHHQSITLRGYENMVLPQSQKQPYLIMVYSELCMMCLHVLPLWQRLVEELEPIGINLATVHYDQEMELAQKLGGRRGELPHVALIIDSKLTYFNEEQFSVIKVIEFIRVHFSRNLITSVTDDNVDQLLQGWRDNKVRVLLFGKLELVRLRYLALAFRYRSNAVFGYVQLNQENSSLKERFGIPGSLDSLLLFHEDSKRPAARLSMADLPFSTMKDVIDANKYLQLPRLSSQAMLDSLCPPEKSNSRRRLCAILVTEDRVEDDETRDQLRQFTRQFKFSRDRVMFTYIFKDKQNEFLSVLTKDGVSPAEPQSHVVVVWRQDIHRLSYSWLSQPFVPGIDHWNSSKEHLQTTLTELLRASQPLPYQAVMKELVDEHALGIITRITNRIASAAEVLRDHVTRQDLLAVGSVIGTVLFIAAISYVMSYLVRLEEETIKKQNKGATSKSERQQSNSTMELKLHELRGETYNGLIRLLKPGCRTIILLVDNSSKLTLIPKFHKAVWPYRKNKSLMFGWMSVDRGLHWYSQLLSLALKNIDDEEGLESGVNVNLIKPKNCVGTVLSLNGHRKYFCIYHARHPENLSCNGGQRMQRMARRLASSTQSVNGSGAFMGFDTSTEESDHSDIDVEKGDPSKPIDKKPLLHLEQDLPQSVVLDKMLDGLSNWLDRLFEGSTHRYYINYWPDFGIF